MSGGGQTSAEGKGRAVTALMGTAPVQPAAGLPRTLSKQLVLARLGMAPTPAVGRYRIERRLGEGGMGSVFLAHDPELMRSVAIKVLKPETSPDAEAWLAREARALARLTHENVVVVYDVGTEAGQLWIAMEFVAGRTLREWRRENPEAGWVEVTRLLLAAARGLAAAHRAGVVHRDFKPDNVMVGDDGRVRVADFGLAVVGELPADPDRTAPEGGEAARPVVVHGTPGYLPPEVLEGAPAGPHGDQYSFFVTLRELLTPGPGVVGEPIPGRLAALIARGVAERPEARWPSMDDVVAALESLTSGPADTRRRSVLLERVQSIWLDGVWADALAGRDPVALDLVEVPGVVDAPWRDYELTKATASVSRTTAGLRRELASAQGALLLLGRPGAGKTTALLTLTAELLYSARQEPTAPVPVVLNLASLSTYRGSLMAWLVDELVTKYGLARLQAAEWLREDALALMLDGLDEVIAPRRPRVIEAINAFRRDHPVSVVITCREESYAVAGARLELGRALRIQPLDDDRLSELCQGHGPGGETVWEVFKDRVDVSRPVPLVVSLLLEAATSAPELRVAATDEAAGEAYDTLVARALRRPPVLATPERRRLLAGLSWLARMMRRVGTSDLWLERLQADWLPSRGERRAAVGLGLFLLVGMILGGNLLASVGAGRSVDVGLVLGLVSLPVPLVLNRGVRVRPREALGWSWRLSLRRLPLTLGLATVAGLAFGAFYVLWTSLVLSLAAGGVLALTLGLEARARPDRIRAAQGLRRSLLTALVVGVATGAVCGFAVGYGAVSLVLPFSEPDSLIRAMADPRASFFWLAGVTSGLLAGFVYGGTAIAFHVGVRLVLAARSPLPLRLAAWLDRAAERGLIRRVGGGWIFQHGMLRDYFADR
jgi:predicted Ser/Thr protein kinase